MLETQELIGEELVDATNAHEFADRMFAEAQRLWESDDGWRQLTKGTVVNESIPVSGVFAAAAVDVVRARAIVDAPAQVVFDLLVSPEGYKIIDPFSDPKDHEKPPLETFDTSKWRSGGSIDGLKRLEITTAFAKIPLMKLREFVVLNAIDSTERLFASKSIQHASTPGASEWGPPHAAQQQKKRKAVRALNTFAARVTDAGEGKCLVELINYAALAGRFSPTIQNKFNRTYLTGVVNRLAKAANKAQAA